MTLIERLVRLAELWAADNERSVSRLATIVANDGKLFDRIASGGSCTVATFDRFVDYLRNPANWGADGVPAEAASLLNSVRVDAVDHGDIATADDAVAGIGKSEEISSEAAA